MEFILTSVKIFQFLHDAGCIIGQSVSCRKENLIAREYNKDSSEYDYDIDALTGEILSFDQDAEYDQRGVGSSIGNGQTTEEQTK